MELIVERYKIAPMEEKIIDTLWRARGRAIDTERMLDAMYADDPNGGPDNPYSFMKKAIHTIRKKLAGSGVEVVYDRHRLGYRLIIGGKST